jgi:hypothetical protein
MQRRSLGVLCVLVLGLLAAGRAASEDTNSANLTGRWKNTGGTIYFSDGSTVGSVSKCWIESLKYPIKAESTWERD